MTEKQCTACKKTLPIEDFGTYRRPARRDPHKRYVNPKCRKCQSAKGLVSYHRNKEKYRGNQRAATLRAYGLTVDDYARMLDEQGGVCAVCGTAPAGNLHVDHDHTTGRVRGLLCVLCNTAIGKFHDSPSRMRAAAAYIERVT